MVNEHFFFLFEVQNTIFNFYFKIATLQDCRIVEFFKPSDFLSIDYRLSTSHNTAARITDPDPQRLRM